MSLMSLVRWIGAVMIGWTLVAIGIGACGARLPDREATVVPWPASASVEAMPRTWPNVEGFDLIDRTTGRTTPIPLPKEDRWSELSIAPRRGPAGELEAVGRWVNPHRDDFGGWAVFRLSDGAVRTRIPTEILPTGPPTWVPGDERMILFAAADGQLYRCRLASGWEGSVVSRLPVYASGRVEPSDPVVWEAPAPGSGEPMLTDPVWPADPRLKRLVFVALMPLERRNGRRVYGPSKIWWLEMSDDAKSIVAAGPLTDPAPGGALPVRLDERFPNVSVGSDSIIRLVYLERRNREKTWRLRSAVVEFDERTGRPSVLGGPPCPVEDHGPELQSAPVLVSTDGATAYALSHWGRLVTLPVSRQPR